ncbi:MAG: hypothetical protein KatS3mg113_0689 [Planctomycetaceae bacterium]|nr:MAG: hypothetical protein KatS3mg113_0689 [Planctomycetaceae bacterium]
MGCMTETIRHQGTMLGKDAGSSLRPLVWDQGRLWVHPLHAGWLRKLGLTTAASLWGLPEGIVYRQVPGRTTRRVTLGDGELARTVFIKQHAVCRWYERCKSWLQGKRAVWGAVPEWEALWLCGQQQIPTLEPILCAQCARGSLLMTSALEGCEPLDHWWQRQPAEDERRQTLMQLAQLLQRFHRMGWHHQDLYLCHVLRRQSPPHQLYLIDLGRAQRMSWPVTRWIVKDLAQLYYSTRCWRRTEWLRFWRLYRGRPLSSERRLWGAIQRKAARIAHHSQKHRL